MAYKFHDRIKVPDKELNKKNIETLFSITGTFNINAIADFTANNNMSYNVTDNTGKSVLHYIIGIDDITKKEDIRLYLTKYFIENGASVDTPDINNVTPLHLACKNQYSKIVEFLIKNGAVTDYPNSELMTPLHYAVQGDINVCEKIRITDSIIPDPEPEKMNKIEALKDVKKLISSIIFEDNYLNSFISNIVRTIRYTRDYDLNDSINRELDNMSNTISRIYRNRFDSTTTMEKKIQKVIYASIESIRLSMTNIHRLALTDLDFTLSTNDNNWGLPEFDNIKILNSSINLKDLWKELRKELPDKERINGYFTDAKKNTDLTITNMKNINTLMSHLRIYLHYYVFSNQDEGNDLAAAQGLAANLIDFHDGVTVNETQLMLESDNVLRHPKSLTIRDSIMDFDNSLYLQGFHNYNIYNNGNILNFARNHILYSLNGPNPNQYSIIFSLLLQILNLVIDNQNVIQQSENLNNIPLDIVNLQQFIDNILRDGMVFNFNRNQGFLFVLLANVISQNNKTELTRILDEYEILNGQINLELKWHYRQLIDKIDDLKLIFISCLQAYLRIVNANNASMTYYFKIIFDAINEWHSSNDLDKLKITIINGFKKLYFILNNLNNGFAANVNAINLPLRVIGIIPTILLNRNNDDLSQLSNNININLPPAAPLGVPPGAGFDAADLNVARDYITNNIINIIYAPNGVDDNDNIKSILYLANYLFGNIFRVGIEGLDIERVSQFLDTLLQLPPGDLRPFDITLINQAKKESSPIEMLIRMCKYYNENQPGSPDIKNKTQLDMMITCLRNIYYKGNSSQLHTLGILNSSMPPYDRIGIKVQNENRNANKTFGSIISSLVVGLMNGNEFAPNNLSNIFRINRLNLANIENPNFNAGQAQDLNGRIIQDEDIFVLCYLAACISNNNIRIKEYSRLYNNTSNLIEILDGLRGFPINPIILETFNNSYLATQDLVLSFTDTIRNYGLNDKGCMIIREALYFCQNLGINEDGLTNTINNIITAAIFNLEYLGRVEEMDRINQYQIKIGRNDRFLAARDQDNNGPIIEGTYNLGEFINDGVIARGFVNPVYWNTVEIPRPSTINSMEIAINRRIQRYVDIVDSIIIKDSRNETTLKILSNILRNRERGYQYWQNLFRNNMLSTYNQFIKARTLINVSEQEERMIQDKWNLYISKIINISQQFGRTDIIDQAVNNNSNANNGWNIINENVESNIVSVINTNNQFIEILNKLNGYNYINYVINTPNSLDIQINKFTDGFYPKLSMPLDQGIEIYSFNDNNDPAYPVQIGETINNDAIANRDENFAYSGLPIDIGEFSDLNTQLDSRQQIVRYINDQIYRRSRTEKASKTISVRDISRIYLYMVKEALIKNIITNVYDNRNNPGLQQEEIFDSIINYMREVNISIAPQNVNPYIFSIVGEMANELINNFISYTFRKYASRIAIKFINNNVETTELLGNFGGINNFLVTDRADDFTTSLDTPSSRLIQIFAQAMNPLPRDWFKMSFDPILSKKIEEIQQYYLYNQNYSTEEIEVNKNCIKINPEIIRLLIEYYCNPNKRDDIGQSAIFYAIKNASLSALNVLLNEDADFKTIPNKNGDTPFIYALNIYNNHLNYMYNLDLSIMINNFTNNFYDTYKDIILGNPNFRNNLINYSENSFNMVIAFINHKWFTRFFDYSENWTYDNKKDLINLFYKYNILSPNNRKNKSNGLYIIDTYVNNPDSIISNDEQFHALKYQKNKIEKDNQKLVEEINNLDSAILSINDEINEAMQQNPRDDNNIRNLRGKANRFLQNRNDKNQEIIDNNNEYQNIDLYFNGQIANLTPNYNRAFNDVRNNLNIITEPFMDSYQNIITNLDRELNKESNQSYNQLWKEYLGNNNLLKNCNNIILLINQTESALLEGLRNGLDKNEVLTDLNKIKKFYDSIEKDIISYFHLPNFLDENPILNLFYEIAKNITSSIIASNMELAIKNIMFDEYKIRLPYENYIEIFNQEVEYYDYIFNLLNAVFQRNTNINGNRVQINNFLLEELNDLIVKQILNIKQNKKDTSTDDFDGPEEILKRVNDVLKLNLSDPIIDNEDSKIIDYLNKSIIPYYALNYKLILPRLKAVFDNYLKYIINNKRHLDIFIRILEKI
jgi:hypothetical protein